METQQPVIAEEDHLLTHLDNCYKLFDPDRTVPINEMTKFIQSPIPPVVIIAAFIANTRNFVELNVNDKFIQDYIKKYNIEDATQLEELNEQVSCIKACVFSGKPIEECSVFLYVWKKVLEKFVDTDSEIVELMKKVDLDESIQDTKSEDYDAEDEAREHHFNHFYIISDPSRRCKSRTKIKIACGCEMCEGCVDYLIQNRADDGFICEECDMTGMCDPLWCKDLKKIIENELPCDGSCAGDERCPAPIYLDCGSGLCCYFYAAIMKLEPDEQHLVCDCCSRGLSYNEIRSYIESKKKTPE